MPPNSIQIQNILYFWADNATMRKVGKTIYFEQERLSDMLNDMCLAVKIMTVLSN